MRQLVSLLLVTFLAPARANYVLVEPRSGLGNRMRALASATVLAKQSGRNLIVAWRQDAHCNVSLDDLFVSTPAIRVIVLDDDTNITQKAQTVMGSSCKFIDQMVPVENRQQPSAYDMRGDMNLCISTCYTINIPGTGGTLTRGGLDEWVPSAPVEALQQAWLGQLCKGQLRRTIGLHIRQNDNIMQDVPGIGADDIVYGHLPTLRFYRNKCEWPSFLPLASELAGNLARQISNRTSDDSECESCQMGKGGTGKHCDARLPVFLVASDRRDVPNHIKSEMPFRVIPLDAPPECYEGDTRTSRCQQYALATMLVLVRAQHFVGSDWSSFTEMVDYQRRALPTYSSEKMSSQRGCWSGYDETAEFSSVSIEALQWNRSLAGPRDVTLPSGPLGALKSDIKEGVSIIMACRDRPSTIYHAFEQACQSQADELIVVDWSSAPPVVEVDGLGDAKRQLKVFPEQLQVSCNTNKSMLVRVGGETAWNLARANNLALSMTTRSNVLKIDCDTALSTSFLKAHVAPSIKGGFYAGNWKTARTRDERHLNGIVFAKRCDLLRVGGYDERISTYSWDDTDLSTRLEQSLLVRMKLDHDTLSHLPHNRTAETGEHDPKIRSWAYQDLVPRFQDRISGLVSPDISPDIRDAISGQLNRMAVNALGAWDGYRLSSIYSCTPTARAAISMQANRTMSVRNCKAVHTPWPLESYPVLEDKNVRNAVGISLQGMIFSRADESCASRTRRLIKDTGMWASALDLMVVAGDVSTQVAHNCLASFNWVVDSPLSQVCSSLLRSCTAAAKQESTQAARNNAPDLGALQPMAGLSAIVS